jgi:hypothetical protein
VAAALYTSDKSPSSAASGMPRMVGFNLFAAASSGPQEVLVWPENEEVYRLFRRVGTQWALGGLRYEAIYPLLDRMAKDEEEWDQLLYEIQVMEAAALDAMSDKKKARTHG